MQKRSKWRWLFTGVSTAALVVVGLNVERIAEAFGLDRLLIAVIEVAPNWLSNIVEAVTSQMALIIAIATLSYTAGLWTEYGFRHLAYKINRPLEKEDFANLCEELVQKLRAGAELAEFGDSYMLQLNVDLIGIRNVLADKLDVWVPLDCEDKASALQTAEFLELIADPIRNGDSDTIQKIANGFKPKSELNDPATDAAQQIKDATTKS